MDYPNFLVEIDSNIAKVSFNNPSKANSLLLKDWQMLRKIFTDLDADEKVHVIILKAEGKHFCAGMNMMAFMNLQQSINTDCEGRKREALRDFILELQSCITQLEKCSKPVIAAVHGGCIGGGLDIVAACDMRFSTEDAFFVIKEVDLGIIADLGTLQRLPKIINPGVVAEMAYTGRNVMGTEAEKIGLVNKAFDSAEKMYDHVDDLAKNIASKSTLVIRGTKQMLLHARDHSVQDSLNFMATHNSAMMLSNDLLKGI